MKARKWRIWGILCPALLLIQGFAVQVWDMNMVRLLYPLLVHLPLIAVLVCRLGVKWHAALIAVAISYSACQLLRWIGLVVEAFGLSPAAATILHLALCQLLLMLLDRFCLDAIYDVLDCSERLLGWFGALPVGYYLYEYFMMYTQQRFLQMTFFSELLPTALVVFFVLFAVAYQRERARLEQAEKQTAALEMKLAYAENEITTLRVVQEQTAIYRHDLHHHLMMIGSLLSSGQQEQAAQYIHSAESELEAITPVRYCENETVNLILCAFRGRAEEKGVRLSVQTSLPKTLDMPDTELCVLMSNGLENALNAAAQLSCESDRFIDVFCAVRQSSLLIEIKNSYTGEVAMAKGLPVARDREHGYGCRSIQSIVHKRKGVCSFEASKGIFVLRLAIPLNSAKSSS